ncbi:hypothetical protein OIO90_004942 [Microbotryomycetes sp. JL221]|nr:hypothetical protein OIO90_004942 [Microbotryomycetes sp. JL221]
MAHAASPITQVESQDAQTSLAVLTSNTIDTQHDATRTDTVADGSVTSTAVAADATTTATTAHDTIPSTDNETDRTRTVPDDTARLSNEAPTTSVNNGPSSAATTTTTTSSPAAMTNLAGLTTNKASASSTFTDPDNKSLSQPRSNDTNNVARTSPPANSTSTPSAANKQGGTATRQTTTDRGNSSTKKRGFLASLFGCCVSSDAYDDERRPGQATKTPATTPSATSTSKAHDSGLNEKSNAVFAGTSPTSGDSGVTNEKANLTQQDAMRDGDVAGGFVTSAADGTVKTPTTAVDAPPATTGSSPDGTPLPLEETGGVTAGAVMPPGKESTGRSTPAKTKRRRSGKAPESIITQVPEPGQMAIVDTDDDSEGSEDDDEEDEEQSLIARGGVGIPIGEDGLPHPLLDEISDEMKGRKCLVLDLDETLVHSSFKMVHQADYVVPVEIENQYHNVYVIKRPGVDAFLKAMGEIYEVVVFTASLSKYADPVLDQLDVHQVVKHRLFRESCYNNKGNYVKDLSQLGRAMADCIIIDNSPASYVFHVNNAVPISSWFNDPHDTELTDLVPFLTDLEQVPDVRSVLDAGLYQHLPSVE